MATAPIPFGPLLAAAVLALQAGAAAQLATQGADPGALPRYRAPERCPDATSWVNEVLSRLDPEARELARRELPVLVEALEVAPDGQRAALRLRGAADERVIIGRDCSEVLAGAALITAIAFGSEQEHESPVAPTASAPDEEPAPTPSEPPPAPEHISIALELERDIHVVDAGLFDGGAQAEPKPLAMTTARWAIGAGAATHTGFAPWPAALLDGGFELFLPEQRWSVRVRGSLGLARASVQQRSARFLFIGGGVDVCPLVFGVHLDWQWRNCVAVDLGRVQAEGEAESALRSAAQQQMWWSALGLVTRLQSPRAYGFRVELEAGVSAPLWHRELEFRDPNSKVFETPALALSGRLGLQVPLE